MSGLSENMFCPIALFQLCNCPTLNCLLL